MRLYLPWTSTPMCRALGPEESRRILQKVGFRAFLMWEYPAFFIIWSAVIIPPMVLLLHIDHLPLVVGILCGLGSGAVHTTMTYRYVCKNGLLREGSAGRPGDPRHR